MSLTIARLKQHLQKLGLPTTPNVSARMDTDSIATTIPNTASGPGAYATKQQFTSIAYDTSGGLVADLTNHRMNVIAGYKYCRIGFNLAFAQNSVGWRGCRIKNGAGANYGNQRVLAVAPDATTNASVWTPWLEIKTDGSGAAPKSVNQGDYFELYPAQTSGGDLGCGLDLASSWYAIEFKN